MLFVIILSSFAVMTPKGRANPAAPVISSVTSITAANLQSITISGSGFGNTQPLKVPAWDGDGSVDTVVTGTTPVLCISNSGIAPDAWAAGVENASNHVHCAIGLYIFSWSDTVIVLGGFGSALNTNGQDPWNIAPGDPLDVFVWTPSGETHYKIKVESSTIMIYEVKPSSSIVFHGTVGIKIGVTNKGTEVENFDLVIKEQRLNTSPPIPLPYENWLGNLHVSSLQPGASKEYSFTWNTMGFAPGAYIINVYATIANARFLNAGPIFLQDIGYVILVAGKGLFGKQDQVSIDSACNRAYETLREVGFPRDHICYLNPWPQSIETQNDVWKTANSGNLEDAIENWAGSRVNRVEPLFLYIFAHGSTKGGVPIQGFTINSAPYGLYDDVVYDNNLSSWLGDLKGNTGAQLCTICNFCYSGTFLDDLSPLANVAICSCGPTETDHNLDAGDGYYVNFFSSSFWTAVHEGFSIGQAFNVACKNVKDGCSENKYSSQTPLLDDNNDGVGHTGPVPNGSPSDVDGLYALNVHIGHCRWSFPWVSSSVATQYSVWPPTGNFTLWAKVENDSSLSQVEACMIPPDFVPPVNDTLGFVNVASENSKMTDLAGDGNFTVNIPAVNFTNHASGPSNFTFAILVVQKDNMTAYPCFVNVVFTENGQPLSDTTPPNVHFTRPLDEAIVHGVMEVNGTTSDDVCLQKCELYVDGGLLQTITFPQISSSYFDFSFDTGSIVNGNHTVMVESYDASNNTGNESVNIHVVNGVHDITIAAVNPSKTVVFGGSNLNVTVAVVNHGSHTEDTNITVYANSTPIGAAILDNLTIDGLEYLTFTWNTTGFSMGNYTISAYASSVPGETNTDDNNFTGGVVAVAFLGDINGDGKVDIGDVAIAAKAFGSHVGWPRWNPDADVNGDGVVSIMDIALIAKHFGQHSP
jgi:hypothetical protein